MMGSLNIRVEALLTGRTKPYTRQGSFSAIDKYSCTGSVHIGALGLASDEQGDPRVHGGPDKAVHHYAFEHYAFYNAPCQRIEMHLVSRGEQTVTIGDERFMFRDGETLHTESSHKFTNDGLATLAAKAGFGKGTCWTDPKRLFSVHWLPVV